MNTIETEQKIVKTILSTLTTCAALHRNGKIVDSNRFYEGIRTDISTVLNILSIKIENYNSLMEDVDTSTLAPVVRYNRPHEICESIKESGLQQDQMVVVKTSDLFKNDDEFMGIINSVILNLFTTTGHHYKIKGS